MEEFVKKPLTSGPSAIDQDGMAGNQRGRRRGQKHDRARHFHGFADAMQGRDALHDVCAEIRIGQRFRCRAYE